MTLYQRFLLWHIERLFQQAKRLEAQMRADREKARALQEQLVQLKSEFQS